MNDAKAKKLFVMGNDGKPKRLIVLEFDGGEHHAYKTSSWHKLTLKDGTPLGIPEQKIELGREIMHKTQGRGLVIMLSDDHATFGSMMHKVGQAYHKIKFGGGHASDHIKKNASDPLRHQGELIVFLDHGQDMSAADEDGFSDPYVKLVSGGLSVNSRVVPKTLNPSWKQELKLVGVLEDFIATGLLLKVSDSDGAAFLDDYLGNVFLSLEHLRESHVDRLFEEQLDTSGKLVFRVGWDEYEPALVKGHGHMSRPGKLTVKLLKGAKLVGADGHEHATHTAGNEGFEAHVALRIGEKEHISKSGGKTSNPEWNESFAFEGTLHEFVRAGLHLRVMDAQDHVLGIVRASLGQLRSDDAQDYSEALDTKGSLKFEVSWEAEHMEDDALEKFAQDEAHAARKARLEMLSHLTLQDQRGESQRAAEQEERKKHALRSKQEEAAYVKEQMGVGHQHVDHVDKSQIVGIVDGDEHQHHGWFDQQPKGYKARQRAKGKAKVEKLASDVNNEATIGVTTACATEADSGNSSVATDNGGGWNPLGWMPWGQQEQPHGKGKRRPADKAVSV